MKKLLILLFLSLFLISACNIPKEIKGCTAEGKVCLDGSVVGRIGPNCEFEKCPIAENSTIVANYTIDLTCNSDEDCGLINQDLGLNCNYQGPCGSIDFSKDNYIALNFKSFHDTGNLNCPPRGGAPGSACQATIINNNYAAKCISGICKKVEKPRQEVITLSGTILSGSGDCMPPIVEENRQYYDYNGNLYFIHRSSIYDSRGYEMAWAWLSLLENAKKTEVKNGNYQIKIEVGDYIIVIDDYNKVDHEIKIEENKVIQKEFKFFKCLSS